MNDQSSEPLTEVHQFVDPSTSVQRVARYLAHKDEVGRVLDPTFDTNASIRRNVSDLMTQRLRKDLLLYTTTPTRTMPMLEFLAATGFIKTKPTSWKDLFFEDLHGKDGS